MDTVRIIYGYLDLILTLSTLRSTVNLALDEADIRFGYWRRRTDMLVTTCISWSHLVTAGNNFEHLVTSETIWQ